MSTNFPTALDTLVNPSASDDVAEVDHAAQHANANDAIEALQAKVGVDDSEDQDSHDYKLSSVIGDDRAASAEAVAEHVADTENPHEVTKDQIGLGNVDNTSDATKNAATAVLENKTIDADANVIENIDMTNFRPGLVDTDITFAANSDERIPSQKAVKALIENSSGGNSIATVPSRISIDGSTAPVPVMIGHQGVLNIADADEALSDDFFGFIAETAIAAPAKVEAEGNINGENPSGSVTLKAGQNKAIVVFMLTLGNATPTEPTSITWNGHALTKIIPANTANYICSTWIYVAGDLASDVTGTLTVAGAVSPAFANGVAQWYDLSNVDQADPYEEALGAAAISIGGLTPDQNHQLVLAACTNNSDFTGTPAGYTVALNTTSPMRAASVYGQKLNGGSDFSVTWTSGGGSHRNINAVLIRDANPPTGFNVIVDGVLDGFSGLTVGARYYVTNTVGTVGTTPGSTSVLVGRAISETELLIIPS